jgi:hypothetical protein
MTLVPTAHRHGDGGMEELSLAEGLQFKAEKLRNNGLEGAALQLELRHMVWHQRHRLLDRSIGEA